MSFGDFSGARKASSSPVGMSADAAYLSFRAATLIPLAPDLLEQPKEDDGPLVYVWINEKVRENYVARGVFPAAVKREPGFSFRIPAEIARAMLADARAQIEKDRSRKAAAKWWMLADRLRGDLERLERAK